MLNEKEKEIFDYIKERLDDGIPPTFREIRSKFNYSSTAIVNKYINTLKEKGYIEKTNNQKRNIKLPGYKSFNIPVIDFENYTQNFMDIENIKGYVSWTPDNDYEYPLFAVKSPVDYNSIINKGDIIIAEKTFHDGRQYYIEETSDVLHFTDKHTLKCIGRIISVIKYMK